MADPKLPQTTGWQPIGTAPHGREVLVWHQGDSYTAVLLDGEWWGTSAGTPYFEDDGSCGEYEPCRLQMWPKFWMEKPEGPADAE